MAQIILYLPDDLVARVLAGMCGLHNYQETITDPENPEQTIPNPETKVEFIKRIIRQKIKRDVLEWEGAEAQRTAYRTGETDIQL
jgi:hypothetical protein